jgi:hypothetical protein
MPGPSTTPSAVPFGQTQPSGQLPSRELFVQVQVNRGNARAGGAGADPQYSALISVLLTVDGAPVSDLGFSQGDGTSKITLPNGWSLFVDTVAAGGCGVDVTQFANDGNGVYYIRIVPSLGVPGCTWLSGDYVFALQLHVTSRNNEVLQGSALAKLTVP